MDIYSLSYNDGLCFRGCWAAFGEDWFNQVERACALAFRLRQSCTGYSTSGVWTGNLFNMLCILALINILGGRRKKRLIETRSKNCRPRIRISCCASCAGNDLDVESLSLFVTNTKKRRKYASLYIRVPPPGPVRWFRTVEHPGHKHKLDGQRIPLAELCQSQLSGLRLISNWYLICD